MTTLLLDADSLWCKACASAKPKTDFHTDSSSKRGFAYYCKTCANSKSRQWHASHIGDPQYKRKRADSNFRTKYNLSLEQREKMLAEQNRQCRICKTPLRPQGGHTHTDHCHTTGKVRGLLCTNCNRGLGHFQDSVEHLQAAIEYLTEHKV